jgi:hypothetical protein
MSDADLTLDPLAGGIPIEPRQPEPTAPKPTVPEPTDPQAIDAPPATEPVTTPPIEGAGEPDAVEAAADAVVEAPPAAEPIEVADPVAPAAPVAPPTPQPTPEEIAAMVASAPPATPEEIAALATAAETALPLVVVAPQAQAPAAPTATEPAKPRRMRRPHLHGWMVKLVTSLFALALFVGGISFGQLVFQRTQAPAPLVGDPSTGGVPTPGVVSELASAIESNDADAMRSAVAAEAYGLLTSELQRWDVQGVSSVETLATMKDGPRSATELVIIGKTTSGDPVVFNLVVQVNDNQIVGFR